MEILFLSFQGKQRKRLWDFGGFMDINHLRYSEGPGLQGLSSSIYTAVGQKGQKRRTGSREGLRFNRGKTRRCYRIPRTQLLLAAHTLPLFHSVCSDHIIPLKKRKGLGIFICPNSLWGRPWDEDTRSSQFLQETQRSEMKRRRKPSEHKASRCFFFFFSEHRGRKPVCPEDNTMHQKYPTCIHLAWEHVQVRMFLRLEVGGS